MHRCCCSATAHTAGSTWSIGAVTAMSGGSIPRSTERPVRRTPFPDRPRADERPIAMEIADLLTPRGVLAQLRVSNKKALFQEVARRAASLTGVAERRVYEVLSERERTGTT